MLKTAPLLPLLLRRPVIPGHLRRRRLHLFRLRQQAAQFVGCFQRALDMFVVGFAFEEDQDVAVGALSCVAALDTPRAIPKAGIASGAAKLD
jgi:hypothetical protein